MPPTDAQLEGVRRKRAARVRRRLTAGAACLALVGGGVAVAMTRSGDASTVDLTTDGDGQRWTASGRVVRDAQGRTRMCAPEITTPMIRPPAPPVLCELGVDVRGVDFSDVSGRHEMGGAVEGRATVVGRLEGDVLVVERQTAGSTPRELQQFFGPPCDAPASGWPTSPPGSTINTDKALDYRQDHPGEIAEIAIARPTATTYGIYVLTYGEPRDVVDALHSTYGGSLCVRKSDYTPEEVQAARADPTRSSRADGVFTGADQVLKADGQLAVQVEAVRETPALQALVARHPAGLVQVVYWLHPVD